MPKTEKFELAEKLTEIYMNMDMEESNTTEVQKVIRSELENREYNPDIRDYSRTDFFRKRIDKIVRSFAQKEDVIQGSKKIIMPKPTWDIMKYNEEEKIEFFKTYIELTMELNDDGELINRKAKYNIDKKIDVENDYSFVMEMLKKLDEKNKYPDLNQKEDAEETVCNSNSRQVIVEKAKYMAGIFHTTKEYAKNNIIRQIGNGFSQNEFIKSIWDMTKEPEFWLVYSLELVNGWYKGKDAILSTEVFKENENRAQKKYYVLWNLWVYIMMQTFQYSWYYGALKDRSATDNIVSQYEEMATEIEKAHADENENLISGYYRYNSLLKIRTELLTEVERKNMVYHKYVKLKEEDLFLGNKCVVKNSSYTKQELCRMFHSGEEPCKVETFNKRLEECKSFCDVINKHTPRQLNTEDYKILRAVYRTRYVNDVEYKRRKIKRMMDDIMRYPEERDENLLSEYYIVGMAISRENMNEKSGGEETNINVDIYMPSAYKLALLVLYRDYPYEAEEGEEFMASVEKLEEMMQKTLKIIYKEMF